MKTLFIGMLTFSIMPLAFGQAKRDFKRLDRNTDRIMERVSTLNDYFTRDQSVRFACFPDYEQPFKELAANISLNIDKAKHDIQELASEIHAEVLEDINLLLALKDKSREPGMKEIISLQEEAIQNKAQVFVEKNEDRYREIWQRLNNLDGDFLKYFRSSRRRSEVTDNFRDVHTYDKSISRDLKKNHMQGVVELFESCQTASCVYLLAADLKQFNRDSVRAFSDLRLIRRVSLDAPNTVSSRRINNNIDNLAEEIAKNKPLGEISIESCMGNNTGSVESKEDDQNEYDLDRDLENKDNEDSNQEKENKANDQASGVINL